MLNFICVRLAGFTLGNLTHIISNNLSKKIIYNVYIDIFIQILLCSILLSFIRLNTMWQHQIYLPGIFLLHYILMHKNIIQFYKNINKYILYLHIQK
jgi:hypothetical protein